MSMFFPFKEAEYFDFQNWADVLKRAKGNRHKKANVEINSQSWDKKEPRIDVTDMLPQLRHR